MTALADRTHYVYRLYDADDQLLYIGCTHDVQTRVYHLTSMCNIGKGATGELIRRGIARQTATEYPNRAAGFAAERAAVHAERPLLNVQSVPGMRRTAAKRQAVDRAFDGDAASLVEGMRVAGNTWQEIAEHIYSVCDIVVSASSLRSWFGSRVNA